MIKKNTKSLSNWIFCVIVRVWFVQFYLNKASIFNSLRTLSFAFFASLTKKVAIDFTLAFHWLRGWRTFSRPIIEPDEAKPIKSGSTFHTRLKIAIFFVLPFKRITEKQFTWRDPWEAVRCFSKAMHSLLPRHIPTPYKDVSSSQNCTTFQPQTDSRRRSECLFLRTLVAPDFCAA